MLALALLGYWAVVGSLPGRVVEQASLVDVRAIGEDFIELCGPFNADGSRVLVTMVSEPQKRDWIDEAAADFSRSCPNIQLRIIHLGDHEALEAFSTGELEADLWSPSSYDVLELLEARWGANPFAPAAAESLLRDPLVWITSRDRVMALEHLTDADANAGPWTHAACGGIGRDAKPSGVRREQRVPRGWDAWASASLPEPSRMLAAVRPRLALWGQVRFSYPHPQRSFVGFGALRMIALDLLAPPGLGALDPSLRAAELERRFGEQRQILYDWVARCQAGIPHFEASPETLALRVSTLGIDDYHITVLPEAKAFELLTTFDAHPELGGELALSYPRDTVVREHPGVLAHDRAPLVIGAATRWLDYLHSAAVQRDAIHHGLRPIEGDAPILADRSSDNPFLLHRRYGASVELPSRAIPTPRGELSDELLTLWSEATGRI